MPCQQIDERVIAGHSQGGTATLFAGEIAGEYAPELTMVGLVSLALGGEFPTFVDALASSPLRGSVDDRGERTAGGPSGH